MSRLEERENLALSSLHDISDYSNYIDQRISKLNNLYQSLTITQDRNSRSRKQKQFQRHSLTRQPPQQLFNHFPHRTQEVREKQQMSPEQMYRTEYFPRRDRYHLTDDKEQIYNDLKSLTLSNFRNSIDASRCRVSKLEDKKPTQKKLQIYKQIKNDILGTFYVGGRTLSNNQRNPITPKYPQQEIIIQQQPRIKRGKLWHGRPPVKIIEKYD